MAGKYTTELLVKLLYDKKQAKKIGAEMGKTLTSSLASAVATYGIAEMGRQFVVDSFLAQAEAERLGTATDNLGKRFGVTSDLIVESIQKASRGTISEIDAMRSANQAMLLDVVRSQTEFAELSNIAVSLGSKIGRDATESITVFNDALADLDKEPLRDYGIVISDNVNKLEGAAKKQAFFNEVLSQGREAIEGIGGVADDRAGDIERLTASWSDFQVKFGDLTDDVGTIDRMTTLVDKLGEGAEAWSDLIDNVDTFASAAKESLSFSPEVQDFKNISRGLADLTSPTTAFGIPVEFARSMSEGEGWIKSWQDALQTTTLPVQDLVNGIIGLTTEQEALATSYQALIAEAVAATEAVKTETNTVDEATIAAEDYEKALSKVAEAEAALSTRERRDEREAEIDNLRDIAELELDIQRDRLDAAIDFERRFADEAENLADKRVDITRDSLRRIAELEQQYGQDAATTDYGRKITEIARDLANERLSIERDYQQRLADIRLDFEQSAEEAVRSNDAIGFLRAQRQRDNARADAQTDRQARLDEVAISADQQREQARIHQQQELEDLQLALQRKIEAEQQAMQQRLDDAEIESRRRQDRLEADKKQELTDIDTAEERKRADLNTSYQQQLVDLQRHHNQRLVDLRSSLQAELELINQYEAKKRRAQSSGLSSAGGANYSGYTSRMADLYKNAIRGSRATGDYAYQRGLYELAEQGREFVVNNRLTRLAEQQLGGKITNAGLEQLLTQQRTTDDFYTRQMERALGGRITSAGGGQSVRNVTMNPTYNFSERDDAKYILGQVSQMLDQKLLRLERGY